MQSLTKTCEIIERIIIFLDIKGYHRNIAINLSETELFNILSEYYFLLSQIVESNEGEIIKFIGDGALIIFPITKVSAIANILKQIKEETDIFLSGQGFNATLCVKAGIGEMAYGEMGKGKDIAGKAVNEVALLKGGEFILSDALKAKIDS